MMMARRAGGSAVRRGKALRRPVQARWRRQDGFGGPTGEESGAGGPAGYAAFALRWWWLIAACVLIGGGGAYAYTRFGPVPYQSTALVLAPQQPDSTGGGQRSASASKNTAENYAAQASSQRVFDLAVRALDGKLPEGRRITVR